VEFFALPCAVTHDLFNWRMGAVMLTHVKELLQNQAAY
jgi:hypothetical protein